MIVSHSGNHYKLVSYNDITYFEEEKTIPEKLFSLVKKKCSNVGLYKRIKSLKN